MKLEPPLAIILGSVVAACIFAVAWHVFGDPHGPREFDVAVTKSWAAVLVCWTDEPRVLSTGRTTTSVETDDFRVRLKEREPRTENTTDHFAFSLERGGEPYRAGWSVVNKTPTGHAYTWNVTWLEDVPWVKVWAGPRTMINVTAEGPLSVNATWFDHGKEEVVQYANGSFTRTVWKRADPDEQPARYIDVRGTQRLEPCT